MGKGPVRMHRGGRERVVSHMECGTRESIAADEAAVPQLLTVRDVAKLLQVHEKTIYAWVSRGELPCVRVGKCLRFDPSAVSRWLQARKAGA